MGNSNISIVPDAELLRKAEIKLNKMGMDVNTAFNRFLQSFVENNENIEALDTQDQNKSNILNFNDLPIEEQTRRLKIMNTKGHLSEALGVLNGLIWMADDFDAPLDCMREYME